MTRQKSDDREVPEGVRKDSPSRMDEPSGGGKAVTVTKAMEQYELRFGTAERPTGKPEGANARADEGQPSSAKREAPKPSHKVEPASSPTMEAVVAKLREAFENVASNKGAPGPDGQTIDEVRKHLDETL